jgi:hypothetical protein
MYTAKDRPAKERSCSQEITIGRGWLSLGARHTSAGGFEGDFDAQCQNRLFHCCCLCSVAKSGICSICYPGRRTTAYPARTATAQRCGSASGYWIASEYDPGIRQSRRRRNFHKDREGRSLQHGCKRNRRLYHLHRHSGPSREIEKHQIMVK